MCVCAYSAPGIGWFVLGIILDAPMDDESGSIYLVRSSYSEVMNKKKNNGGSCGRVCCVFVTRLIVPPRSSFIQLVKNQSSWWRVLEEAGGTVQPIQLGLAERASVPSREDCCPGPRIRDLHSCSDFQYLTIW